MRDSRECATKRGPHWRWAIVWVCAIGCVSISCESASHDNINKWMRTEKGPGKLIDALDDADLDADLRAHAGQNLIRIDKLESVLTTFEDMSESERASVLAELGRRLWEDARIEGENSVPSGTQVSAKDALFQLRRFTTADTRRAYDRYLTDWLGEGYYSARARIGVVRGVTIMRTIGPSAAPLLIRRAKRLAVADADDEGSQYKIEDPLLLGLAATGSVDAVSLLLDFMDLKHNDKTLPKRVMTALYKSYINNNELFKLVDPAALAPHVARIVKLARDSSRGNRTNNDAIRLLGALRAPTCIPPLIELVSSAQRNQQFVWVTASAAIRCGKLSALVPVADALPRRRDYPRVELYSVLIEPMLSIEDKPAVARKARTLLESKSWVSRLIGVELLSALALTDGAASDAKRVRKLARDKNILRGYWGDQQGLPKRERKKQLRLGARAKEVADKLDQLAKSG